ncbi:6-bladed beta-propeller [Acidobacteriota bacterium]
MNFGGYVRAKPISDVLLFFALIVTLSCSQKETEWKGTIEEKDGVIIVKNPKEPMYREDILNLEEDLTIKGISENQELIFAEVSSIAVDSCEEIFICDSKEGNIKKFNQNGELLKIIGKRGQGPGEFGDPGRICISNKNELVVVDYDRRRLLFFSNEGDYIGSIPARTMLLLSSTIDSKGNIISHTLRLSQSNPGYEIIKFDSNLNPLFIIGTMPYHNLRNFNPFMPSYAWAIAKNDNIIYGYSNKYELLVLDPNGKIIKKIYKEYDPVQVTELEKEEEIKKAPSYTRFDFPEIHSAFQSIKLDDEGRIYVKTWKEEELKKDYSFDIFDDTGRYIAEVYLKETPHLFKNNKLYSVEEDEDGFHVIKRYKVTWNH